LAEYKNKSINWDFVDGDERQEEGMESEPNSGVDGCE
jgi:hypothetical protein